MEDKISLVRARLLRAVRYVQLDRLGLDRMLQLKGSWGRVGGPGVNIVNKHSAAICTLLRSQNISVVLHGGRRDMTTGATGAEHVVYLLLCSQTRICQQGKFINSSGKSVHEKGDLPYQIRRGLECFDSAAAPPIYAVLG